MEFNISESCSQARAAFIKLLEVKETSLRAGMLEQAYSAADKGMHIGGAFSALIPLTALYYGGYIDTDVENPTDTGNDIFILSKGHAVAALAQIYADMGYFDESVLYGSRSLNSILNGHPGPLLPGVHVSTGPLGEGICVAEGFAIAGKRGKEFNVFAMTGDGELQEGIAWEAFMYAAQRKLSNFCVLVDCNDGQLDDISRLIVPFSDLGEQIESFGWNVCEVDSTRFAPVLSALDRFKYGAGDGRPTAILCKSAKGYGGFSSVTCRHKIQLDEKTYLTEKELQEREYNLRAGGLKKILQKLDSVERRTIFGAARAMNLDIYESETGGWEISAMRPAVKTRKAQPRDKRIAYDSASLPKIIKGSNYSAADVISGAMRELAKDGRIVSVDSDLSSVSGLQDGVSRVDKTRALNVGIAEANMMNIGEAFAALGYNVWVSTFCPFFNWQVIRRIAVGYQERLETMVKPDGWLSGGHGLDLTFVATAANLDTTTNGATHMGNDDIILFAGIPNMKIIDVSCPRQLLGVIEWIAGGNKGMVYLRIMRAAVRAIYSDDFGFEYGKGYILKYGGDIVLVSSGRGVHECLSAEKTLNERGIAVSVVDMPSFDEFLLFDLIKQNKKIVIAEQNNGYILQNLLRAAYARRIWLDADRIHAVNTSDANGKPRFIHSGTYEELTDAYRLDAASIAELCLKI